MNLKAVCLVIALLSTACAASGATMSTNPVFQSIEYGNGGHGVVKNVAIVYGSISLPAGRASNKTLAASPLATVYEAFTVTVPESVTIRWTSADGQDHEVIAPARSIIRDAACFHGFQFFFVDDHVDVYLLNRKYDCSKVLDVERIKVYSSAR
jgi:hypothetical protein